MDRWDGGGGTFALLVAAVFVVGAMVAAARYPARRAIVTWGLLVLGLVLFLPFECAAAIGTSPTVATSTSAGTETCRTFVGLTYRDQGAVPASTLAWLVTTAVVAAALVLPRWMAKARRGPR